MAGVCTAIASARLVRSVTVVENRPVQGAKSSSEIRVWVCRTTSHGTQRNARGTGIMGRRLLESHCVDQVGNPYLWHLVVHIAVWREPSVRSFLNTEGHHLQSADDGTRTAVVGWQMGSDREPIFTKPLFLDLDGITAPHPRLPGRLVRVDLAGAGGRPLSAFAGGCQPLGVAG